MTAAVLISPDGASGALRGLMDRLASVGVAVAIVGEVEGAVDEIARHDVPPAVMLDLRGVADAEPDDVRAAAELVSRTVAALPHARPIAVVAGPTPQLVVACIRAGAGDVLDVLAEGTAAARSVVQRICQRQEDRQRELAATEVLRELVEDLLKDLIRTERRAIDAEEAVLARTRTSGGVTIPTLAEVRPPTVLLVEADRRIADELVDLLEDAGIATFAYVTGEEAVREVPALAQTSSLDLALVAARLPGMSGLEAVRLLREQIAGLPAFLMTSAPEDEAGVNTAELGVVGVVQKPFAQVGVVIEQLVAIAHESAHRTREALYLQRIKERHERVLERYRTLPRTP